MADTDIIKKSVTAGDYADTPRGGVINFMLPWYPGASVGLPPTPPDWWSRARDYTLRSTTHYEDMWKAAIEIAITKMASLSWEVDSEIPLRARRGQDILNDSDWFTLLAKGLRDFLTTDNGQFIEIVRTAKSPVSMAIGLAHLDSIRCTRTGDNEIPVIYADRKGREHEIRAENVIFISDMPDPGDTWFGVGECAASGAYRSIYKLAVIERYVSEKVSGRRPLAIHFVSSVGQRQLDGIIQSAEEGAARQGLLSYMGAIVVPLMDASTPPEVATVPLAELPDRFNRKEEYDIALYSYAANIGLDIQDLQPLTGQPLGTGAQSQVLDEKQKGKGLVYWKKILPGELNLKVFDDLTTFAFIEKDYRDQERQAGVSNARATASKTRIDAGITTPAQEMQILVDLDELPNEFLPEDVTGETLSDDEKPEQEEEGEGEMVEEPQPPKEKPQNDNIATKMDFVSDDQRKAVFASLYDKGKLSKSNKRIAKVGDVKEWDSYKDMPKYDFDTGNYKYEWGVAYWITPNNKFVPVPEGFDHASTVGLQKSNLLGTSEDVLKDAQKSVKNKNNRDEIQDDESLIAGMMEAMDAGSMRVRTWEDSPGRKGGTHIDVNTINKNGLRRLAKMYDSGLLPLGNNNSIFDFGRDANINFTPDELLRASGIRKVGDNYELVLKEAQAVEDMATPEEKPTEKPEETPVKQTTKGGQGSGNFGHAGRPGEVGGSSTDGGIDVPDYFYSKDARTLPPEIDNRLDGGPGKSIQFHGTPQKGLSEFNTDTVYLQDNPEEAKGYASQRHAMQNKKGGEILQVRRKPGKTLNLDPELLRRMEEGDDPDSVIEEYLNPARDRGFRYIYFEHPTFSGEGSQKVIVSLYPKEDLRIIGRSRNKEFILYGLQNSEEQPEQAQTTKELISEMRRANDLLEAALAQH